MENTAPIVMNAANGMEVWQPVEMLLFTKLHSPLNRLQWKIKVIENGTKLSVIAHIRHRPDLRFQLILHARRFGHLKLNEIIQTIHNTIAILIGKRLIGATEMETLDDVIPCVG